MRNRVIAVVAAALLAGGSLITLSAATSEPPIVATDGQVIYVPDGVAITIIGGVPSATPVPSPSPTVVPSPTAGPTATNTPEPTSSPAPTATATTSPTTTPSPTPSASPSSTPSADDYILLTKAELMSRPTSGTAWNTVMTWANQAATSPDLSDQDDPDNLRVLAKAIVYARTGTASYRTAVLNALDNVQGTEAGARSLAIGREAAAYVLAADFIDYHDPHFVEWVGDLRTAPTSGGPTDLIDCHEDRPNNWGTHCGASRMVIDLYIGDAADLFQARAVFRGWLGDRSSYSDFRYGDISWQSNPSAPVGINPVGATIQGRDVDGVLPDDQRRGGSFSWPPPCENYVHEALMGATLQAILTPGSWDASNRALVRAYDWLYENNCPATGDDRFVPHIYNHFAGTSYPETGNQPGKNFGFTDWLFAD